MNFNLNDHLFERVSIPSRPVSVKPPSVSTNKTAVSGPSSFASVLANVQQQNRDLKFSSHAESRIQQRGLVLTPADVAKLQGAIDKAGQKGSKDVYVVYGEAGFVVNVPNRTVVTAMLHQEEPVVTNIDSVVVVSRPDH